ncbi:hypothetical protein F5Y12DRAFT_663526 [Xylaria sp. FL1777]|nr:hypothetical protein F5Y12DRAFT_663526 [Xylaria sp. FL1777]
MRFSIITLGLATVVQSAILQTRDSGCTVNLQPTLNPPQNPVEIITYGSLNRWSAATGGSYIDTTWVDYSGSSAAPYSFKYKANTIPFYETDDEIAAVLSNGWVGTYLAGGATPTDNDFLITSYSCN